MKLFDKKTFVGWYRLGLAYGLVIGILGVEFVRAVIRIVEILT